MSDLKPVAIEIFNQYSTIINKSRKEIIALPWFGNHWWLNVSFGNQGYIFQLSKTNWFNHNGKGIHFEFWLGELEHRRKIIPFVLHFEPDTPDRKTLGAQFKGAFAELEQDYPDYVINYQAICDKLQKYEKFSKNRLPRMVSEEFSRLQKIGAVIDRILDLQVDDDLGRGEALPGF